MSSFNLKISLETDNDAFQGEFGKHIILAVVLDAVQSVFVKHIEYGEHYQECGVWDPNGNNVGEIIAEWSSE